MEKNDAPIYDLRVKRGFSIQLLLDRMFRLTVKPQWISLVDPITKTKQKCQCLVVKPPFAAKNQNKNR